jgi:hypothetical protein
VEIMVTVALVLVMIVGMAEFRGFSASHVRKADVQMTAARLAVLLLEDWKAGGGQSNYDPVAVFGSQLNIAKSSDGPAVPDGFSRAGYHRLIVADGVNYYATLSYREATESELHTLNVAVAWLPGYGVGEVFSTDQSVRLTTYVR